MKKILVPLSIAIAQLLAVNAFAAGEPGTGEAGSAPAVAPAGPKATPAEKAAAKANRKVEGKEAPKVNGDAAAPGMDSTAKAPKVSKAARKAARAKRKAAAAAAVKNGEIKAGEGDTAK